MEGTLCTLYNTLSLSLSLSSLLFSSSLALCADLSFLLPAIPLPQFSFNKKSYFQVPHFLLDGDCLSLTKRKLVRPRLIKG